MSDEAVPMIGAFDTDGVVAGDRARSDDATPATPGVPTVERALIAQCEPLVAQLLFAGGHDRFGIAVTSAIAGEGVTSTSVGLAIALADSTSKDVLIVDANLRRPAVHTMFNVGNTDGLSEVVTAWARRSESSVPSEPAAAVTANVRVTAIPNLYVLPSGKATAAPAPLITSDSMRAVIGALRSRFGYIIVDCPPVLTSVETSSLCRLADGVVLVIRAGVTPRDAVASAQARLAGTPLVGAVLTGM